MPLNGFGGAVEKALKRYLKPFQLVQCEQPKFGLRSSRLRHEKVPHVSAKRQCQCVLACLILELYTFDMVVFASQSMTLLGIDGSVIST